MQDARRLPAHHQRVIDSGQGVPYSSDTVRPNEGRNKVVAEISVVQIRLCRFSGSAVLFARAGGCHSQNPLERNPLHSFIEWSKVKSRLR